MTLAKACFPGLYMALLGLLSGSREVQGRQGPSAEPRIEFPPSVTLFLHDDVRQTVSLSSAEYGRTIYEDEVVNKSSQAGMTRIAGEDYLLVAMAGSDVGRIVDLGDIRRSDTLASIFASLQFRKGRFQVAKPELFDVGADALSLPFALTSLARAKIEVGHVYIGEVQGEWGSLQFCLRVTAHTPAQTATVSWRVLAHEEKRPR